MAVLTDEQLMLRDMAANWVRDRSPVTALRSITRAGQGHDPALWKEMAEMGWPGILIPEGYGGSDFGHAGMALVLEETGRMLVASPLLASGLVGAVAVRYGGSDAQKEAWLPRIASADVIVTLALEEGGRHDPAALSLTATRDKDGWRLDGVKSPVLEGGAADVFIVVASGPMLFLVERDTPGLIIEALDRIDGRDAAIVRLDGVKIPGSAALEGGATLLDKVLDSGRAGFAAEMLGAASQALDTTLEYLRTRVQFDQLIGSFQALQHRAVAMQAELVMARSAVEAALQALDDDGADRAMLVSLAKALAGDAFRLIAREMVQMHGGIGMTEEHDAGLYYKRAAVADATWGTAGFHRGRYARIAGY